ncbi:hypothetical protein [Lignipirellula cremea]|nr:hypothetical protein [Lignipirellula cremea]
MRRHLIGIIGLAFCLAAAVIWQVYTIPADGQMVVNSCLRIGLVMCAIWLAFPQAVEVLSKYPPWVVISSVLSVVVVAANPKLIIVMLPLLMLVGVKMFITWVFTPPPAKPPRSPRPTPSEKEQA